MVITLGRVSVRALPTTICTILSRIPGIGAIDMANLIS